MNKLTIPIAIDDCGFVSWSGNNWDEDDKLNITTAIEKSLEKCRNRPPYVRQDRVLLVEVDIDFEKLFVKKIKGVIKDG